MKHRFKEQEDWPLQDPQDPLTIIDSVEISLVYSNEAKCDIDTTEVVRYVHFNRMLNRIIIDNNRREIEEIENETNVVKDELNARKEEISNLKRDLKKTKVDMASMHSQIRLLSEQVVNEEKIHQVINSRQGIELRGGTSWMEGNLFVDGKPVCDDRWETVRYGNQNAGVVCRMLGFSKGVSLGTGNGNKRFGAVPSTDWSMDDVACTGTETDIRQCPAMRNCGGCGCKAHEGAGVVCSN